MSNFARIINGVAVDVSAHPHDCFVPELAEEFVPVPDYVCPQWRLVGMGWMAPEAPAPAPEAPLPRRITPLAFLLRFTPAERVGIDLASIGNTIQAATVRMYLQNVNLARYVDLDDINTMQGLQAMEAGGLLSDGRADQIISAPVQAGEIP